MCLTVSGNKSPKEKGPPHPGPEASRSRSSALADALRVPVSSPGPQHPRGQRRGRAQRPLGPRRDPQDRQREREEPLAAPCGRTRTSSARAGATSSRILGDNFKRAARGAGEAPTAPPTRRPRRTRHRRHRAAEPALPPEVEGVFGWQPLTLNVDAACFAAASRSGAARQRTSASAINQGRGVIACGPCLPTA